MRHRAGDEVPCTITYLEMGSRPATPRQPMPAGAPSALIAARRPPAWYFLALYDAVGKDYDWSDLHARPFADIEAFLHHPAVAFYTLVRAGWPHGFFMLDGRTAAVCELAYFGLVPQAIGQGLGKFLLSTAVHMAWDRPGTECVTVNTCSLDHPRALPLYQRAGFKPVRRETYTRKLSRDRDVIGA